MIKKITVKEISRKEVEQSWGVSTKTGIKCDEFGDRWLSTFSGIKFWKEGTVAYINVTENGEFLNFKPATVKDAMDLIFAMKEGESDTFDKPEEVKSVGGDGEDIDF